MSRLTDLARTMTDEEKECFVRIVDALETMEVTECDRNVYGRHCDQDHLGMIGMRCHVLAANIKYLRDHPEWNGEGSELK